MGYTYKIVQDPDCWDNPRDWDNLGTMVCWHRRCSMGDETIRDAGGKSQFQTAQDVADFCQRKDVISLPVYLYEHSGQTVRTYPFGDRWDSGQVGFIFVTKEKVRQHWGVKKISNKLANKAKTILVGEVETYDDWLTGNVWGYQVFQDGEEIDACWGYFGEEGRKQAEAEAQDEIAYYMKTTWVQLSLPGMEAFMEVT